MRPLKQLAAASCCCPRCTSAAAKKSRQTCSGVRKRKGTEADDCAAPRIGAVKLGNCIAAVGVAILRVFENKNVNIYENLSKVLVKRRKAIPKATLVVHHFVVL